MKRHPDSKTSVFSLKLIYIYIEYAYAYPSEEKQGLEASSLEEASLESEVAPPLRDENAEDLLLLLRSLAYAEGDAALFNL